MRKQKGFSLIELLIVVAIILIIAAIAVPNLLRSRMAANEASAVGSTRVLVSSEFTYYSTFGGGSTYASLANLGSANLIDTVLAAGTKSGYTVAATPATGQFYTSASPVTIGTTGQRAFCSIEDGAIRFQTSGAAFTTHDTCTSATILQ
jgi:prepilin-type N-terminal cleavage/methylation domain-containing protein